MRPIAFVKRFICSFKICVEGVQNLSTKYEYRKGKNEFWLNLNMNLA